MIRLNLIYCKLSEFAAEQFSVGGYVYNDDHIKFIVNFEKLALLKKLLGIEKFNFIKEILKSFQNYYKNSENNQIFEPENLETSLINSVKQFNNTILISETHVFDINYSKENIDRIVNLYIKNQVNHITMNSNIAFKKTKEKFKNSTRNNLNFNYPIDKTIVPGLEIPLPIDFAGKNGTLTIGEFIPTMSQESNYMHKIESILSIAEKLKINEKTSTSNVYIITDLYKHERHQSDFNALMQVPNIKLVKSDSQSVDNLAKKIKDSSCIPLKVELN